MLVNNEQNKVAKCNNTKNKNERWQNSILQALTQLTIKKTSKNAINQEGNKSDCQIPRYLANREAQKQAWEKRKSKQVESHESKLQQCLKAIKKFNQGSKVHEFQEVRR